jgi:arsenate reductase (thioredoxin)
VKSVLFVCIHNSARSQMAEAFVNASCGGELHAYSAGLEGGNLNPVVVDAMAEIQLDIAQNRTKTVADDDIRSRTYDYVVTVCDEASAEACPIYPSTGKRLHWSFPDPSSFTGTRDEKLEETRKVRDDIAARIRAFCVEACP